MTQSDVQPMLWVDEIERAIDWYSERLGFEVMIFGRSADGRPNVCLARLDGSALLLTRDPVLALDGAGQGSGHVRLYFHLQAPVDDLHERVTGEPGVEVVQGPTSQHWGDRTVMLRDPWGTILVFSNREGE